MRAAKPVTNRNRVNNRMIGHINRTLLGFAVLGAVALAAPVSAQAQSQPGDVYPVYPAGTLDIPAGAPPETADNGRVRNVTIPTLTVFHPKPGADTGTAIIVAPGGGFEHLSMINEGSAVARRLADLGVTAIVLKYRLAKSMPHPPAPPVPAPGPALTPAQRAQAQNSSPSAIRAMADGDAAVAFVRAHATDLHIAPNRIGFLGFSAGAVIALHVATNPNPAARPDFAAAIYGAMPGDAVVPKPAPPLFLAVAADDKLVGPASSLAIFTAWHAAGSDAELHLFQSGGHGFGMTQQATTSDRWIDEFTWWLQMRGLLRR